MRTYPGPPTGRINFTAQGRVLTIERTFRATIEDVWASLTEPDHVAQWFGVIAGERTPGNTLMITMTAEEGAPTEPARLLECDPPHRFVVETPGAGEPWRLTIALAEAAGTTTLTFTQVLPTGLDAADIGPGWEYYADRHRAAFDAAAMPNWEADRYQDLLGPHYAAF